MLENVKNIYDKNVRNPWFYSILPVKYLLL